MPSKGLIFIMIEFLIKKRALVLKGSLKELTYRDAFLIGLVQSLAIVPGVSRAGAVIVGMMLLKYKRSEAAVYSFLLAVPTILGASILDLIKTDVSLLTNKNLIFVATGFLASFVSALAVIKWLITYLQKNSLVIFGVYRIILAVLLFRLLIE